MNREKFLEISKKLYDVREDSNEIKIEWITGGVTGGNCWNDDGFCSLGSQPEEDIDLEPLVSAICPGLTFLTYQKIMKRVLNSSTYTVNEYYGNSSDYAVKTICLIDLYDALVEFGAITSD